MDDDATQEAYRFSAYGGPNPFRVDGAVRGSQWLEGPLDGARTYVCEWQIAGELPDFAMVPRFALGDSRFAAGRRLPRVRTADDEVDLRIAAYSRARELPRAIVVDSPARGALLGGRCALRVAGSRGSFERHAGADVLSRGFQGDTGDGLTFSIEPSEFVPSRVVAGTADGIRAARALVRRLDELVRKTGWSESALFEAGTLDAASLQRLLHAVLQSSSWLGGDAAVVGAGVEARLALSLGALELASELAVRPLDASSVSIALRASLPDAAGGALTLEPEGGIGGWLRALREHEIGDKALDEALLIEGDERRLADVRAAQAPLAELLAAKPRAVIEAAQLRIDLACAPFDDRLSDLLGAALETWERVSRRRLALA